MSLYKYTSNNVLHFTFDINSIPSDAKYTSHEIWC